MKPALIVSDWNGTLITDLDDRPVLKQIAMDELKYAAAHLRFGRVAQLARTKKQLESMIKQYGSDPQSHAELLRTTFELYGNGVLKGIPMQRVMTSIDVYAEDAVNRLDPTYAELCEANIPAEILTSALGDGINAVMEKCDLTTAMISVGDASFIVRQCKNIGGGIFTNEIADGLVWKNYDNKSEKLRSLINSRKDDYRPHPDAVVYMGNDLRDEPCAEVAGRFVVAPLAADEYRHHMATTYGSKVRTPGRNPGEVLKALTMD